MAKTIFQKILDGQIPAYRLYEDAWVLAFLDVGPLSPGHTLLIPKEPAEQLHDLSDEAAAAIGRVLPRLCRALKQATGIEHYNVLQNNGLDAHQVVQHVHFHIIPKPNPEQGLHIGWPATELVSAEAEQLQQHITALLQAPAAQ